MRRIRPLLLAVAILALGAPLLLAAGSLSIWVEPGTTLIEFEGYEVRIETTDDVILNLSLVDGEVVGQVEAAPGTTSARVTVSIIGDPDQIIFNGKVVAPIWFTEFFPHETGRGEQ